MTAHDYLNFIVDEIHSTVVATVDSDGLPVTCVIDMMYADGNGLYFLTAKGKNFYQRLKDKGYLALLGKKGEDTMSCTAVSVRGRSESWVLICSHCCLRTIPICLKYTPPRKAARHSQLFSYTKAAESGLTCRRSLSSVTASHSAVQRSGQADIS